MKAATYAVVEMCQIEGKCVAFLKDTATNTCIMPTMNSIDILRSKSREDRGYNRQNTTEMVRCRYNGTFDNTVLT